MAKINKEIFSHLRVEDDDPVWDKFSPVEFAKKHVFDTDKAYLLEDGFVRKYYIHSTTDIDTEISAGFYFPGEIFSIQKHDSEGSYESLTSGVAWEITLDAVKELFVVNPQCRFVQNYYLSRQLDAAMKREMLLLQNSPQALYEYLLKNKPHYIQNIPLKYLASYIGITPISLSRIRKRIN
ncbi:MULTISPECIES: Crp/Fnr family transcriptional regulator [Chryseobacterium]|uniref:CRP-like cAMP-binding protein n=1 Tax=Chryseobacterium camelliae TaxID=1265445 RepID=A0ABU0TEP8_9FLAO|nr:MULTISPECIES: Crp/Fnr family transcriptional regulator [Chryseobacterium]MDT3406656.1 CRP-like cAMP-binding protein [Pseudacidovorax intermedius]MDQ1095546.1 CRP-like cAMP-binding protein [Chryseobacterium camelliae]MDQ1099484.1 CRP-like cAMP-binding protein [Chryseobacterium sp. SORGH_AS_1048]MDR6086831.1 CRP-like cAMP-binding protein [Chryseobacterium sp. SORGH_AS_0909]MDR6131202.1 CRP-like cAMP-binding protein [Chryseobacterium sp. SORGH_AS_1175]